MQLSKAAAEVPGAPAHCTSASVFQTTSIPFILYVMKISLQLHTLFLNYWVRTFAKTPKIFMILTKTRSNLSSKSTLMRERGAKSWHHLWTHEKIFDIERFHKCPLLLVTHNLIDFQERKRRLSTINGHFEQFFWEGSGSVTCEMVHFQRGNRKFLL